MRDKDCGSICAEMRNAVAQLSMLLSVLSETSGNEGRGRRSDTPAAAQSSRSISHLSLGIRNIHLYVCCYWLIIMTDFNMHKSFIPTANFCVD